MKTVGKSGAAIATAAFAMALSSATLVGTATTAAAGEDAKVHCMGVNACKGHSDCKTAENACKGQNSCKGKGFLGMTKEECDAAGGTVEG